MSLRCCRCSRPSSSSTEFGPSIGRRMPFASPACMRSAGAVNTSRIAAGSPSITHGRSSMRTVNASPNRARHCEANHRGCATHAAICAARGARGPGGRAASMGRAYTARRMPAPPTATPDEIRDVNTRCHGGAAAAYDAKWGIDYGAVGRAQVLAKVRKALGGDAVPSFGRGLEIGAGTGYFALNLLQAGVLREAVCTDISPGMLEALERNAARLGLQVRTRACDAEALPFDDGAFDLVFGHAVLHHLPDLTRAFGEFRRVLRPGGSVVFAGEP